jgi:SAM-dependent methyltransferase
MSHKVISVIEASDLPKADLWLAEAQFGFRHVREQLDNTEGPLDILEVGCGSGILLSMLSEDYPNHSFTGIEPFGDGFSALEELTSVVSGAGVEIEICSYEEYGTDQKYDLIYCVNVFEHVDDWRHFLTWAAGRLKDGGTFFVLCPNYGFPYESHFRIPIFAGKPLTHRLFRGHIERFEEDQDVVGLWNSLNFVKKGEVKRFVRAKASELNIELFDQTQIVDDMVSRVADDAEFRKRQAFVGNVAVFLRKFGVFRILKLFPNFLPYMKLSFVKGGCRHV